MSSVSFPSTNAPSNLQVHSYGDGQFGITKDDGEEQIVDAKAANEILAAYGLEAIPGQGFVSKDGYSLGATTGALAAADPHAQPPLPDVSGPRASPTVLGNQVSHMQDTSGISDGALLFTALFVTARSAMQDAKDSKSLRDEFFKLKQDAGKQQIAWKRDKIKAEVAAAKDTRDAALTGALIQIGCSVAQGLGGMSALNAGHNTPSSIWTANLGNVGQSISGLITAESAYESKAHGAQHKADQLGLQVDAMDLIKDLWENEVKNADANYEESKKGIEAALRMVKESVERMAQVTQANTR